MKRVGAPLSPEECEDQECRSVSSFISRMPVDQQRRVHALKNMLKRHHELDRAFRNECAAIWDSYADRFRALYDQRADIVKGEDEPSPMELNPADGRSPIVEDPGLLTPSNPLEKGIPNFWLTAMLNNKTIASLSPITERDVPVLEHLVDVRTTNLPRSTTEIDGEQIVKTGFCLSFKFSPNEYFTDDTLTKNYYVFEDENGQQVLDFSECNPPNWRAGKAVTEMKVRGKDKWKPCDSFFNFFTPIDDQEVPDTLLTDDFAIGMEIYEQLCPHAVQWFTGELINEDEEDEDEDEDDEEEIGEEEESADGF
ncbi:nucleosome assembly protein Nap1 [Pelomyxa schiedti]|nr:nucleosome assembly protein Nap1 [Pelomyxa schiedti]